MPLNCTGEHLPAGISTLNPPETPSSLDDFCILLGTDDEVLLYESIQRKEGSQLQYWVILQTDGYPISVCELEQYADYLSAQQLWQGRRADYLVIGSHCGDCYLIIVELRHVLVKENHEDDKFEQLKETINHLLQAHLEVIKNSDSLSKVYDNPESYKIIGVVIAPGNTRSFSRGDLNLKVDIASHQVLIRTLPKDALSDCKITWTYLLERIGVPPSSYSP